MMRKALQRPAPEPPQGLDPEALCNEVLAEATRKAEQLLAAATGQADRIAADAEASAHSLREQWMESARREAARKRQLVLAALPVAQATLREARVENILESMRRQAKARLQNTGGLELRAMLAWLAAEAIAHMHGEAFVVSISAQEYGACGARLAEEIRSRVQREPLQLSVRADPSQQGLGPIVYDASGLCLWNNTLVARLERLWPALRVQLARRLWPGVMEES